MLKIYKLSDSIFYVHKCGYNIRINGITANDGSSFSKIETVERVSSTNRKKILLDGEEITQDKYQELEREFFNLIYDDDQECHIKEYLYKGALEDYEKFKERIKVEWENLVSSEDVEYVIIDAPKIPEKYLEYITPCDLDGIETFGLIRCDRSKFAKYVFRTQCAKYGFSFDIPTHSVLRFAKIEAEYVFDDSFEYKNSSYPQPLDKAIEELEKIERDVSEQVKIYSLKKTAVQEKSVSDVIKFAESVYRKVSGLSVMKVSGSDKSILLRDIGKFLKDFKATYINDENLDEL